MNTTMNWENTFTYECEIRAIGQGRASSNAMAGDTPLKLSRSSSSGTGDNVGMGLMHLRKGNILMKSYG